MDVYWIEQTLADLPGGDDWLNANEITRLQSMRIPKRRSDWRLGRWTGKLAVASLFGLTGEPQALKNIEVRSRPSGAPEVFINNQRAGLSMSLSHRNGVAACAITKNVAAIGCDLEMVEPHSNAFLADYFTAGEQSILSETADHDLFSSLLWSTKESALKVLETGLRVDTRCVDVQFEHPPFRHGTWGWLQIRHISGKMFEGWWQRSRELVRTLAGDPAPSQPVYLPTPNTREIAYEVAPLSATLLVS